MLPDSGLGYEKWMLIFVIGEPADTAVMSLLGVRRHPLQLRWAHLTVHTPCELSSQPWLPPLPATVVATSGHCPPDGHSAILSRLGRRDAVLHPFPGPDCRGFPPLHILLLTRQTRLP